MMNRIEIIEAAVIGFTQQKQKIESQVVDLRAELAVLYRDLTRKKAQTRKRSGR